MTWATPDTRRDDRDAYRPTEAAERLGISRSLAYKLMDTGELGSIRVGRRRLIPARCIEEFIANRLEVAS